MRDHLLVQNNRISHGNNRGQAEKQHVLALQCDGPD
jgi:hypothetical protein